MGTTSRAAAIALSLIVSVAVGCSGACHGTDGIARAYVDGNQFSESVVLDPTLGPDLDDVAFTFTLGPIGSGVTVSRVFACGTADPLVCN